MEQGQSDRLCASAWQQKGFIAYQQLFGYISSLIECLSVFMIFFSQASMPLSLD